ncbi:MAG: YafY family transcriptional regulator [Devosiaceae bacterium]|nr:YafY family transcriptional regulator [Devosiaceae bacterium]
MRRADRLLQIIQILRRENQPCTCANMADELEISHRTLYRDMVSLQSTGVPVRGEAGIGYVLEEGYHLPPLMFNANELEAIMLGARMVDGRVDEELTRGARDVIAKITAVIPPSLKSTLLETPLFAPKWVETGCEKFSMSALRGAIRGQYEIEISYLSLDDKQSVRIVWPISIGLFPDANMLTAWCTMRRDFRHFRIDRISKLLVLETKTGRSRSDLFHEWKKTPNAMTGDPKKRPNARISGVGK